MNNLAELNNTSGSFDSPVDVAQLQHFVLGLASQVRQHASVLKEWEALKEKIFSLEKENLALNSENEKLKKKVRDLESNSVSNSSGATQENVQGSDLMNIDANNTIQKGKDLSSSGSSWAAKANAAPARAPSHKKRVSAARTFKSPATNGPQGFQYVYIGRSRKIIRSEVRSRLRRSGIDTGRILDISFPASGVLGLLMHVQYVETFTATLKKVGADVFEDFDPLDAKHLADPKYASLSEDERACEMLNLVQNRALDTLSFLRPLVVGPVARSFLEAGWIDEESMQGAMDSARARLSKDDPKKASFYFKNGPSTLSYDSDMEY